jgi:hypothetical protein
MLRRKEGFEMLKRVTTTGLLTAIVALLATGSAPLAADVDDVINVLPKFAIPMREVGDRFQNMYFAAKSGNWGLAYYMSKYMNGAMNPAKVTKPQEYGMWKSFYEETFAPVNKAIFAKDFKTFEKEYTAVINSCNQCHAGMGYAFIQVVKQKAPSDVGVDYRVASKAEDVPK